MKTAMRILVSAGLIIILFCFCFIPIDETKNDEGIETLETDQMTYEKSFIYGLDVGINICYLEFLNANGLVVKEQYENFKLLEQAFYSNPTLENFEPLADIIKQITFCEELLHYGGNTEGFLDGMFVGSTKVSMQVIHRKLIISDEIYQEYLSILADTTENPTHEKSETYTEYLGTVIKIITKKVEHIFVLNPKSWTV